MLSELYIENFAIINKLNINFSNNFNVLTGETGSGKSILIEAIELLTGQRFKKDFIGKNGNRSIVEGTFYIEDKRKIEKLSEYGVYPEDNLVIISRESDKKGKSTNRINGRITTLSTISNITQYLIDIHGQNENQSLLRKDNYINLIDSYDKSQKINDYLKDLKLILDERKIQEENLKKLNIDETEKDREIDLIKFQLKEIEELNLEEINEESLETEFHKLNNINDLKNETSKLLSLFENNVYDEPSIKEMLGKSVNISENMLQYDKNWENINNTLKSIYYDIDELSHDISSYSDGLFYDEEKLFNINTIIEKLTDLKRKYGDNIPEILKYKEKISKRLIELYDIEAYRNNILLNIRKLDKDAFNISKKITDIRKEISLHLEKEILRNLKDLNMKNAEFKISIKDIEKINYRGKDKVEFLIKTNVGQDLKPLNDIASGGELSRIMLGFKSVLANMDNIDTLIFDEIDTGISGRTAQIVGEKIMEIAKDRQVIVISHLPQIAVLADYHLLILKEQINEGTISNVKPIMDSDRIEEISRLIGGVNITDITRLQAKEMLTQAQKLKEMKGWSF